MIIDGKEENIPKVKSFGCSMSNTKEPLINSTIYFFLLPESRIWVGVPPPSAGEHPLISISLILLLKMWFNKSTKVSKVTGGKPTTNYPKHNKSYPITKCKAGKRGWGERERGLQRGKPLGAGESPRFVGFFLSPAPIRLSPLQGLRKLTEVTKVVSPIKGLTNGGK